MKTSGIYVIGVGIMLLAGGASGQKTERAKIPHAGAQAEARKAITKLYGEQISQARLIEDKISLAGTLLQTAVDTDDDPAGQFVLLSLAQDLAIDGCDADMCCAITEELTKRFEVDEHVARTSMLTRLLVEARRTRDKALIAWVSELLADTREEQSEQIKMAAAAETLKDSPEEPGANLIVGRYHCCIMGDWDAGLPMLAKGSDTSLKKLAQDDLARPSAGDKQLDLADEWWDASERMTGLAQKHVRLRAATWYRLAIPSLSGLAKARAEKRMELAEQSAPTQGAGGLPVNMLSRTPIRRSSNEWQRKGGEIGSTGRGEQLSIPVTAKGDYDLRIEITRRKMGSTYISFPLGLKGHTTLYIDMEGNYITLWDTLRATRQAANLPPNVRHVLDLSVRLSGDKARITCQVNGKPCLAWEGPISQHRPADAVVEGQFAVSTRNPTVLHVMKLTHRR